MVTDHLPSLLLAVVCGSVQVAFFNGCAVHCCRGSRASVILEFPFIYCSVPGVPCSLKWLQISFVYSARLQGCYQKGT